MKRIISLITITFILTILIAGCGGGGATGVVPNSQPNPTNTPTQPTATPVPENPIPDGKGVLNFCSDWENTLFELRKIPSENDGFTYTEVVGGTDKVYEPNFGGYTHSSSEVAESLYASDSVGDFAIYIDPGTYYISQVVDNSGEQEKYFLGNFTITEGKYTDFCVDSTLLTTFICRVRFEFPTSFTSVSDFIGIMGTLLNNTTGTSYKIFFNYNDNFEVKEYFFKAKLLTGSYQFDGKSVSMSGSKMAIKPQYIWDIDGSTVEKKVLISNLSPADNSGIYKPGDAKILIGGNTVAEAGYQMLKTNPAGELMVASYDESAGVKLSQQIAIFGEYTDPAYYIGYVKVRNDQATPPANIKMMNCQIFDENGVVSWYNVLGIDFASSKTLIIPVFFYGHPLIGFKVDAYTGVVDVGVGDVYLQLAGNLNSEIVTTFPIRPRSDELKN